MGGKLTKVDAGVGGPEWKLYELQKMMDQKNYNPNRRTEGRKIIKTKPYRCGTLGLALIGQSLALIGRAQRQD